MEFTNYSPDVAAGGAKAVSDVEKEIAKAMPWLKPDEIEAMRKEQERLESESKKNTSSMAGSATGGVSGKQEEQEYGDDEEFIDSVPSTDKKRRSAQAEKVPASGSSFAGYTPETSRVNDSQDAGTNQKQNVTKGSGKAPTSKKYARRGSTLR